MALTIEIMPREFKFKGITLSDPNPKFTVKQVIEHYSNEHPELANGFEKNSDVEDGKQVVEIATSVGTKG